VKASGSTDFGALPAWRSAAPGEEDVLAVLARADEGSRELDGLVYCCLHGLIFRRVVVQEQPILYYVDPELGFEEPKTRFAPVTLSVDAAVSSLDRGWRISGMRFFENEQRWVVSLNPTSDASVAGRQLSEFGVGSHRCLPIAIMAAYLGARLGMRKAADPVLHAGPVVAGGRRAAERRATS
jgi:hypothetical protein